jgi:hypothetical protein
LTLTPVSLDVVAALAHDPDGLRLTPLAHAIGSPVSSVQAALRILLANDLVARDDEIPPRYRLSTHPARPALIELAILLPEPAHVIGVALRASSAVAVASVDRAGFVAGLDLAAPDAAQEQLRETLATVKAAREDSPPVDLTEVGELLRIVGVAVGLRSRIRSAVTIKGRWPERIGGAAHSTTGVAAGVTLD